MNKRQVISVSCVAAIPAAGLLAFLILNALSHGGSMSGVMGVFLAITALLALLVGISPFLMMVWYPTDGFVSAAPAMVEAAPSTDEDDFESDEFDEDSEEQSFDFEDDDDESFDDEYEDFEEDDEDEWK